MTQNERRQARYKNTDTFEFYNANPKGKITCDCVIRALSTATGVDYCTVLRELTEIQCKTGYDMSEKKCYGKWLESQGWKKNKQPRKRDNSKYTGKEFCKEIQTHRHWYSPQIVAHIGGHHIVAIMYGKVNDIWDSTNGCIGNYWEAP